MSGDTNTLVQFRIYFTLSNYSLIYDIIMEYRMEVISKLLYKASRIWQFPQTFSRPTHGNSRVTFQKLLSSFFCILGIFLHVSAEYFYYILICKISVFTLFFWRWRRHCSWLEVLVWDQQKSSYQEVGSSARRSGQAASQTENISASLSLSSYGVPLWPHLVPLRLGGPALQQHVHHVAAAVVGGHVERGGARAVPGLHLQGKTCQTGTDLILSLV